MNARTQICSCKTVVGKTPGQVADGILEGCSDQDLYRYKIRKALDRQSERHQAELAKLRAEVNRLQSQLVNVQNENERLQTDLDALRDENQRRVNFIREMNQQTAQMLD